MDFTNSDCYESILDEISKESAKSERLKNEIDKLNSKIVLSKIALANNYLEKKLCHSNLKIFHNIFDLYSLYENLFDFNKIAPSNHAVYYLLELYIVKSFLNKTNENCMLNINISSSNFTSSKTFQIPNKCPIVELIAIDKNIINSVVTINILFPTKENSFTLIELDSFKTDVSYFFKNYVRKPNKINLNNELNFKPVFFDYKLNCDTIDKKTLMQLLIQNCYHKLDIELFSELSGDAAKLFKLTFWVGGSDNKSILEFDTKNKVLKLKCTATDLYLIKSYISRNIFEARKDCKDLFSTSGRKFQDVLCTNIPETDSLEELKAFRDEFKRLVYQL